MTRSTALRGRDYLERQNDVALKPRNEAFHALFFLPEVYIL